MRTLLEHSWREARWNCACRKEDRLCLTFTEDILTGRRYFSFIELFLWTSFKNNYIINTRYKFIEKIYKYVLCVLRCWHTSLVYVYSPLLVGCEEEMKRQVTSRNNILHSLPSITLPTNTTSRMSPVTSPVSRIFLIWLLTT